MKKPMAAGSGRVNVVPMLLVFCLAYVLGLVSNATFENFYVHHNILSPLLLPASRLQSPTTTPEAVPCILPPSLPPPEPTPPPPPSTERRRMESGSDAMHNMTDEELLWRASMVPRIKRTPKHGIDHLSLSLSNSTSKSS